MWQNLRGQILWELNYNSVWAVALLSAVQNNNFYKKITSGFFPVVSWGTNQSTLDARGHGRAGELLENNSVCFRNISASKWTPTPLRHHAAENHRELTVRSLATVTWLPRGCTHTSSVTAQQQRRKRRLQNVTLISLYLQIDFLKSAELYQEIQI